MIFSSKKLSLPDPSQALPGRDTKMPITNKHFVTGNPIAPPFPANLQQAVFGELNENFGNIPVFLVRQSAIAVVILSTRPMMRCAPA
jgi:hypothetical protein